MSSSWYSLQNYDIQLVPYIMFMANWQTVVMNIETFLTSACCGSMMQTIFLAGWFNFYYDYIHLSQYLEKKPV